MGFARLARADMRYALRAQDGVFTAALVWDSDEHGEQTLSVACSSISSTERVEAEGDLLDIDLIVTGLVEDFDGGVLPTANRTLTVGGVCYYVVRPLKDVGGISFELQLRRTE